MNRLERMVANALKKLGIPFIFNEPKYTSEPVKAFVIKVGDVEIGYIDDAGRTHITRVADVDDEQYTIPPSP